MTSAGEVLKYASVSLRADEQFVRELTVRNPPAFLYADNSLRIRTGYVLDVCREQPRVLQHLNRNMALDRPFALAAVMANAEAIKSREGAVQKIRRGGTATDTTKGP